MERFARPGDTGWIPSFMGAGTTGLVALALGATFIGFDNDEAAFGNAKVRFHGCSPDAPAMVEATP